MHESKVHEEETYLKDFCPICGESGAVRTLCAAHLQNYGMLAPPPRSLIGSKFQRAHTRVLRPAQKRTLVTPNHCQLSTAVIESVPRLQTIVSSFHGKFGVVVKLGPYKSTLDLHLKKKYIFYVSVKWNTYQIFTRKY